MRLKYLMMLFLSLQTTFTSVLCTRMVINSSLSRNESLKFDKKHAILSIESEDGDIIDCIDIYKQPAFDHPALKDHKIQMSPSQSHDMQMQTEEAETNRESPVTVTTQIWHKSGRCPKGTIPVRRSKEHLKRNYGRKNIAYFHERGQVNNNNTLRQNYSVQLAMLHTEGYAYLGAKGDIKVWNPNVELDDEYSTSRVALKSGPYNNFEAMEYGWQVNPGEYGDRQTRLYVYWTTDGSQTTGCFDLSCPGFVQTSNEIALGAAIYPISKPNGLPYQIVVFIYKDEKGNWWVQYGDEINVGYWPGELFGLLRVHAETAQWGGEAHSSRVGGVRPHTSTAIGSGEFSEFVWQISGFVKRMRVLGNNQILKFPEWVMEYSDEWDCYDVYYIHDYVYDPEFYYGGPGRNPVCP